MSAGRSFRGGRRGRRLWLVGATLVASAAFGVVFVASSGAAPPSCATPGNFEIDGDMLQQTCTPGADDWNTPNIGVQSTTQGGTYKTAGKDSGDPSGWSSSGSTPDKTNFAQAYATSRVVNGDFYVFIAWERTDTSGTQGYAIEITNTGSNLGADGKTPQPKRAGGGSVFYISSQGSSAPGFDSACSYTSQSNYGQTCTSNSQLAGVTSAINTASISDPLNHTTQPAGGFFEVALDVTTLTGIKPSCPGPSAASVYLRSITGQTKNGNLKGYVAPLNVAPDSTCVPPPITTTANPGGSTAAIGSSQHDDATVSDGTNVGVGSVKFFLCSPAEVTANGGDCSKNGTQVGSAVTLDGSGKASSTPNVDGTTTPNDNTVGKYCWRAEFTPGSGDHHFLAGSHTNSTTECFSVVKNSPSIVTTPSPKSVTLPGSPTLNDSAVLSGGYKPTGSITFTLVYKGATVDTETVPVSGNGTYTTPTGYTLPPSGTVTGTYQWNASYNGDANNNSVSENNDASEQVTVNPASPSIATTPNPTSVTLGTSSVTLKDSALLAGGAHPTGSITFTLVYKGATVDTETVPVSGNGTYTTPTGYTLPSSVTVTGTYQWNASYTGDPNNNSVSENNDRSERAAVNSACPALVTTASPNGTVTLDKSGSPTLNDSAALSGGYHPSGEITFTLSHNGTPVYTDHVTVSGNGAYSTAASGDNPGGYTLPNSGTVTGSYVWTATYAGDGNNHTASDPGTSAQEQVTVNPASPSIVTTPDPTSVTVSGSPAVLTDSAALSGGYHPTGTITFTLVYNSDVVDTETVTVSGNGTYTTPAGYTLPSSGTVTGTYQWNASYSGDGNSNPASENGDPSEQVTVNPASPAITTTPSESAGSVNDVLNDTATLSDGHQFDGKGTITFSLYGPGDPTCSDKPAYTETVKADHNGDYTTSNTSVLADSAGIWNWTATFNGDGNNSKAVSGCGAEEVGIDSPVIHILKTADQTQVNAGDPIGFTMSVWNSGSGDAKGVTLTDTLPTDPGLHWQIDAKGTGSAWGSTCGISAGVLTCGPIAVPGGTEKNDPAFLVHITSVTDKTTGGDCQESGLVSNTGDVGTSNDGSDQSTASLCVAAPVIHILKTADQTPVNAGDPIGFTMTVWNSGNGDAYDTTLTDTLPMNPGLKWTIDTTGTGSGWKSTCTISAGVLTCGPIALPAGTQKNDPAFIVHITSVTDKTTGGDCRESGLVSNTGDVSTSNDGSDQSTATICVAPADVSITKTADHTAPVHAGDPIGFTVEVKNSGTGAAKGVQLSDPLPAGSGTGVTWAIDTSEGTPGQFVLSGAKGSQTLGLASSTLPAGADYKVHVTAQTSETECSTYDNTATLTTGNANSPDPVSAEESCAYRVDLSVTKSGSPATQVLGTGNITWTMVVKNNGPDTDTSVVVADPMPAGNTFVSATTSKGTCTGGAILNCSIGTMMADEQVTITLITTPSTAGAQTNTVTVAGDRTETNDSNNTASATVQVTPQTFPPPIVYCVAVSKVTPKQLFVGRKTSLTIHLTKHNAAAAGYRVHIKGPKLNVTTKPSNHKGVVKQVVKMKKAGIVIFTPVATKRCNTQRVGVTNVFTPPVTG